MCCFFLSLLIICILLYILYNFNIENFDTNNSNLYILRNVTNKNYILSIKGGYLYVINDNNSKIKKGGLWRLNENKYLTPYNKNCYINVDGQLHLEGGYLTITPKNKKMLWVLEKNRNNTYIIKNKKSNLLFSINPHIFLYNKSKKVYLWSNIDSSSQKWFLEKF